MENDQKRNERIWSFVHGMADGQAVRETQRVMSSDESLRLDVEKTEFTDRYLHTLQPFIQADADEVAEALLDAWEEDLQKDAASAGGVETAEMVQASPPPTGRTIRFPGALRIGLAAAACALVVLGTRNYLSPSLGWRAPEIAPAARRSHNGGEETGVYSRSQLKRVAADLRQSIQRQYDQQPSAGPSRSFFSRRSDTALLVRVHEVGRGFLLVEVEAYGRKTKEPSRSWNETFASPDAFAAHTDALGARIAADLAAMAKP